MWLVSRWRDDDDPWWPTRNVSSTYHDPDKHPPVPFSTFYCFLVKFTDTGNFQRKIQEISKFLTSSSSSHQSAPGAPVNSTIGCSCCVRALCSAQQGRKLTGTLFNVQPKALTRRISSHERWNEIYVQHRLLLFCFLLFSDVCGVVFMPRRQPSVKQRRSVCLGMARRRCISSF